jgi:hypothetical protein
LGLLGWASLSDALHAGLSVKRRGGADANDSLASRVSFCSVQCQTKMEDLIHVAI